MRGLCPPSGACLQALSMSVCLKHLPTGVTELLFVSKARMHGQHIFSQLGISPGDEPCSSGHWGRTRVLPV